MKNKAKNQFFFLELHSCMKNVIALFFSLAPLCLMFLPGTAVAAEVARPPGFVQEQKEKIKVMVVIDEKVAGMFGTTAWENMGEAESTISQKLLNAGFDVVDPQTVKSNLSRDKALLLIEGDPKAAASAGLQYGAQLVITGKALSKNAGGKLYGTQMQSLQATVQARVIRTDDAKVISTRSEQGQQAHIDEVQGGILAIREASSSLADLLIGDIQRQWTKEFFSRSHEIQIVIVGLVSYRHLDAVKGYLQTGIPGVKSVQQRSFTENYAELSVNYDGDSSAIASSLANQKFTGYRLEPTSVTPNKINLRAVVEPTK